MSASKSAVESLAAESRSPPRSLSEPRRSPSSSSKSISFNKNIQEQPKEETKLVSAKIEHQKPKQTEYFFPTWSKLTWLWLLLIPIIIYVILLAISPEFVKTTENNEQALDHGKLLMWTVIMSVLLWVTLWAVNYCQDCIE